MMRRRLLTLVLLSVNGWSQPTQPPKFSTTAQLVVKTDDEALKSLVTSFLSRELRSLGDVVIVDEKPFFTITVLVGQAYNLGGTSLGYVMATQISRPLNPEVLTDCTKFPLTCVPGIDNLRLQALRIFLDGAAVNHDFDLHTGPMNQLQPTCQALIAVFDTKIVAEYRSLFNQMVEAAKKAQNQTP